MKLLPLLISSFIVSPLALLASTPKAQLAAAQEAAIAQKKDILMVFLATDWQEKSQTFEETILKSEVYQNGTEGNFTQVVIACPRERAKASKGLLELQQTYRFREMPSVILTDGGGRPYAYTGARKMDPAAYLAHLEEFHQLRVERDRLFGEALRTEGLERAQLIIQGLKGMPQSMVRDFYSPELAAIAEADTEGETTYVQEIEKAEDLRNEKESFALLLRTKKYEEAIQKAKAKGAQLKGSDAQRVKLYEIQALAAQNKFDEAATEVKAMTEMDPESSYGKQSKAYLASLQNFKQRNEKAATQAPKKAAKPIVSKPVAIVSDIKVLKKEVQQADEAAAQAISQESELKKIQADGLQKIAAMEAALAQLREAQEKDLSALKKSSAEREKLTRRAQAMKEVVETHKAMERRKLDVSDLENKASELQKKAGELRKKADGSPTEK